MKMTQQKLKQGLPPEPIAPPPAPEPAPAGPEFNGTALKMLQQKLKAGLPPTPAEPAPVAAPAPVAPEFNPTALSMLKQKLKQGLPAPSPEAPEALKKLAATAPDAPAPIPTGTPASPEISELINRMRLKSKAAQAAAQPQAAPAPVAPPMGAPPMPEVPPIAPQMPEAPVISKIMKKAGKVTSEEAPFSKEYVPPAADQLWGKGMRDQEFAQADAAKKSGLHDPEAYMDGIIRDRKKRRGILADLIGDDDMSGQHGADLLEALHHTRRASEADGAIKHFTSKMPPKMRDKVRKRMDKSFINSMWKT
jgi:Predicted membrane protein